jgi:hypothetical protein
VGIGRGNGAKSDNKKYAIKDIAVHGEPTNRLFALKVMLEGASGSGKTA